MGFLMKDFSPIIHIKRTVGAGEDVSDFVSEHDGVIRDCLSNRYAGRIKAYVVDTDGARRLGYSAIDALDAISSATAAFCPLYSRKEAGGFSPAVMKLLDTDFVWSDRMLIIDRVELLPGFRGASFGLVCMRALIMQLGLGCSVAALKAFPLQYEPLPSQPKELMWHKKMQLGVLPASEANSTAKLKKYYSRLGFMSVRGTDLMILDLDLELPSIDELQGSSRMN